MDVRPPRLPTALERPPFLVVEGVDGAGKSSHIAAIVDIVTAAGWGVVVTREPGGTPLAERCRDLLLEHPDDLSPLTQALLALAARSDHVEKIIRPALETGKAVVCDRFTPSTHAYQLAALPSVDRTALAAVERQTHAGIEPSCVLFFDIDPAAAHTRLQSTGKQPDRFERRDTAFFEHVRQAYRRVLRHQPHRVIDASRPLDAVRASVRAAVADILADSQAPASTRSGPPRPRL